ncbi:MAG: secondary thiamine-phosphate synthase enzyme YjbQ [Planctomycetota bacterium]
MPERVTRTFTFDVETAERCVFIDITEQVRRTLVDAEVREAVVYVFVPHTTAGVTIQENADPDVRHDLLAKLDRLVPKDEPYYRHAEGNSDSHLKTSLMGNAATVFGRGNRLQLGRWQCIYLAEFDGPRTRQVMVKIIGEYSHDG